MLNMFHPELGGVFGLGTAIWTGELPGLAAGFLGDASCRGIGGSLERFYQETREGAQIKRIAQRILYDLRDRPTGRPDHSWYHLGVDAWRPTEEFTPEGVSFTRPIQEDDRPEDHKLLRSMAWAYLPLEGHVKIRTNDEPPGEIVVSPGEAFLAARGVREFVVDIPVGSTAMQLSFDHHFDHTKLHGRGLTGTPRSMPVPY